MSSKQVQDLTRALEYQHDGCTLDKALMAAGSTQAALKMLSEIKVQNEIDHKADPKASILQFPEMNANHVVVNYIDDKGQKTNLLDSHGHICKFRDGISGKDLLKEAYGVDPDAKPPTKRK